MADLVSMMRRMVEDHDAMNNEAFQVWTWLPSHHFAKKVHGDYADDACPHTPVEVLPEVLSLLSFFASGGKNSLDSYEARVAFACRCGECEIPSAEEVRTMIREVFSELGLPE